MITRRALPLLALPAIARGQPRGPRPRIGLLHPIRVSPQSGAYGVLSPIWRRLGYVEGETVLVRAAGGDPARLRAMARELAAADIRALLVVGGEALRMAVAETQGLPIIAFDLETNPVRAGFARSYARPGGQVTGFFLDQPSLAGKWIDLLREVKPDIARVLLLWDAAMGTDQLVAAQEAAAARGLGVHVLEWRREADLPAAMLRLADGRAAVVTLTSPGFTTVSEAVGAALLRARVPGIAFLPEYLGTGYIMSYGPHLPDHFGRGMLYVERILAGTPPGDLPIVFPERFRLILDGRAAGGVGVELPVTLLAQAEEVRE